MPRNIACCSKASAVRDQQSQNVPTTAFVFPPLISNLLDPRRPRNQKPCALHNPAMEYAIQIIISNDAIHHPLEGGFDFRLLQFKRPLSRIKPVLRPAAHLHTTQHNNSGSERNQKKNSVKEQKQKRMFQLI